MDYRKVKIFSAIVILLFATAACNFVAPTQAPQFTPTVIVMSASPALTAMVEPTSAATSKLPLTDADVPRVPLDQAKAALDSGAAIFVDVRTPQAYEAKHIKGAISIPLGEIEINPTGLKLDKNQWIITYCTWLNEHTSARAAFDLIHDGYKNVTPILGGFQAWLDAGYPVEP